MNIEDRTSYLLIENLLKVQCRADQMKKEIETVVFLLMRCQSLWSRWRQLKKRNPEIGLYPIVQAKDFEWCIDMDGVVSDERLFAECRMMVKYHDHTYYEVVFSSQSGKKQQPRIDMIRAVRDSLPAFVYAIRHFAPEVTDDIVLLRREFNLS